MNNQIRDLNSDIQESRSIIEGLEEKIGKAGSIISTLERQNEDLKRTLSEMEGETARVEDQAR